MTPLAFTAFTFGSSALAGLIGALLGLGGGMIIVPVLTLFMGVDIHYAVGASIVSVIATSSGAAAAYIRDKITNIRIGMFLETATTTGAVAGAFLAGVIGGHILFIIFGLLLGYSAVALFQKRNVELPTNVPDSRLAERLKLAGNYYDAVLKRRVDYRAAGVPAGFVMMFGAGVISGLLGIGSGVFKVLAMDIAMRLPMKVSTATSNFMIGVTAAASAGVYFARGDINPFIAAPVALGVLGGATVGTRVMTRLKNTTLRKLFVPVLLYVALQMVLRGLGVHVPWTR